MARTVSERLQAAIRKVNRPGSFCATGSDRAANPGLEVDGLGPVGLPLTASQAGELKARCEQAPYGKGEETLVDTSVRRVWQLDPGRFSLTNPDWPRFLRGAVGAVQSELGLEGQRLDAHLYNLLLYEPGSFFLPHRDGERLDRMVATLVVVLPSSYAGGELVVRHEGVERVVDFAGPGFNRFDTHFAAFYADCEHEVRPLRGGHRLCLVYNLTLARARAGVSAPRTAGSVEEVARVLRGWSADDPTHKLVVPLGHRYTQGGLAWDALKGVDRVKARVLREAAKAAGCQAHLAQLTFWESSAVEEAGGGWGRRRRHDDGDDPDDYEVVEVLDSSLTLDHWADDGGGRPEFGEMAVEPAEVVPRDALTKVEPEQDVSGYTGNEGLTMERWYRHAAVALWPDARRFDVLCDCGVPAAVGSLRRMVDRWRAAARPDPAARGPCVELAARLLARSAGTRRGGAEADDLLGALVDLGEPGLVRTFLRDVAAGGRGLRSGKAVRAACEAFGWETFREELLGLFAATAVDPVTGAAGPSTDLLERNLGLLEAVCATGSRRKRADGGRVGLCADLAGAFVAGLESLDRAAAAGHDWRLRNVDRPAVLAGLTRSLLATGQSGLLAAVVDRVLADEGLYPLAVHVAALTGLRPWLRTHLKARCEGVARWVDACRERLGALTSREPAPPADLRREADIDCRCADCAELRRFLADPAAAVHRFRAAQDRRTHLEHVIRRRRCDVDCRTERVGSPHVLVCTKNTASFQARLKKYHEDCGHLATLRAIGRALPA